MKKILKLLKEFELKVEAEFISLVIFSDGSGHADLAFESREIFSFETLDELKQKLKNGYLKKTKNKIIFKMK